MPRKKTQAYTEEFRREAVKRSEKPGVTQAQVAEELGISAQQIANWKRQFTRLSDKQFNSMNGVDYSKQESEEIRRLKRELNEKNKEIEFLKKAAVGSNGHCNSFTKILICMSTFDDTSEAYVYPRRERSSF